ncbi:MAG: hypothetical protein K1X71_13665 [Pirellulales bacterium]|nr:hypothetical protein [Pirellulales bacterium]
MADKNMGDNQKPKKQPRQQTPEERAKRFAMQSAGEMSVWDEQEKRWVKLSEMAKLKEDRKANGDKQAGQDQAQAPPPS